MTDKGEKPNCGFVSDQAGDSVNELVGTFKTIDSKKTFMRIYFYLQTSYS